MMHDNWHEICESLRDLLYHDGGHDEHQWASNNIELSGFAVTPRMDGAFGIYYIHASYTPYAIIESITREKLAEYRSVLAAHNIYTSLQEPTVDNGQQWLLYRPPATKQPRLEVLVAANGRG